MRYPYSWSFGPGKTGVSAYGSFYLPSLNIAASVDTEAPWIFGFEPLYNQ